LIEHAAEMHTNMDRTEGKRRQVREALKRVRRQGTNRELVVADAMTAEPSCIAAETTALELIKMFHAKQFRHLLVTDATRRLIGVISDRDLLGCVGPQRRTDRSALERITAADIMSRDLVTVRPEMPLQKALAVVHSEGISCLPVLVRDQLVGILTNTDLQVVLQELLQSLRQEPAAKPVSATALNPHN